MAGKQEQKKRTRKITLMRKTRTNIYNDLNSKNIKQQKFTHHKENKRL